MAMPRTPGWANSLKTHVWVFSVERGLAVFMRTALNQGILYDCGCDDGFSPLGFVAQHLLPHLEQYKNKPLAQRVLSHPHADHITEIGKLAEPSPDTSPFASELHTCPHDRGGTAMPEQIDWTRVKNPDGTDSLLDTYRLLYEKRKPPLQTISYESNRTVPGLGYGIFYLRPPVVARVFPDNDQEYANGSSIALYYQHGGHTLLLLGDMNPHVTSCVLDDGEGVEKRYTVFRRTDVPPDWHIKTTNQPSLRARLGATGCSVLLAPHHGLESGFSTELYEAMKGGKPGLVVVSEKRHLTPSDGKIDGRYQGTEGSRGQDVLIEGARKFRNSVTTMNGHHILVVFDGTGGTPGVFLEKDPTRLLAYL